MPDPFIAKLKHGAMLTQADEVMLRDSIEQIEDVEAGREIMRDGARPGAVRLVLEGLACRCLTIPEGRSQIMAFLVPGDLCDFHVAILDAMDHNIKTLTRCKVAYVQNSTIDAWTQNPRVNMALWWATLVDEAIMRQWIVNLGARRAEVRISHLLLELLHRFRTVGLATDKGYALPISQEQLGECTGLSAMHVNRVLQKLRDTGLVTFQRHYVAIGDFDQLKAKASFDPAYLHLHKPKAA